MPPHAAHSLKQYWEGRFGKLSPVWELAAFVILLGRLSRVGCAASSIMGCIHRRAAGLMKTVTSAHIIFALCGIAAAQTTATYVGNITNDPAAAYAWITDTAGVHFPSIQPRVAPPTVNLAGVWNASLAWSWKPPASPPLSEASAPFGRSYATPCFHRRLHAKLLWD